MTNRPKEQAQTDFIEQIKKSWTFERMTEQEKENCLTALWNVNHLRGDYRQRWEFLNDIYRAFLLGIGYNGAFWREPNKNDIPQF